MTATMIRALVTLVVAVALGLQAARATTPWRRRAFGLGAGGFALIAVSNLLAGPGTELITFTFLGLAAGLMIGALFSLWRAYSSGEMAEQIARARNALDNARDDQRK